MGLPALVAVVLLGKDALLVADRINDNALKRETAAVDRGITMLGELHAAEIVARSLWDSAFRNVVQDRRPEWVRRNFGRQVVSSEGVQQLIIVDPTGKAIFSSDIEAAPPEARVSGLLAAAAPSMERARAFYRAAREAGRGFGRRMPGAMTDGIYVNDVIRIDGRPAMITVSPITPDVEKLVAPKEPTLLLGVKMMTDGLLGKLEAMSHVDGLAHASAPGAVNARGSAHAHAVRDARGHVVTYVTWQVSAPGYVILRAAMPAIAVSLGLIALMTTLAAVTMRRLTRHLAESEQIALHSARHDAATGLANRRWFMRVFADLLLSKDEPGGKHAVMLIDCDYFKTVNDTLGHAAGDAVLVAIAERLTAFKDGATIAARLGGDEFALVAGPLQRAADAAAVLRRVEVALMRPVPFEGHAIPVSVSIGAVVVETPSQLSIDTWLAKADTALYRAKRDGRGCARLYDEMLDDGADIALIDPPTQAKRRVRAPERAA